MDLFDFGEQFLWQDLVLTTGSLVFLVALLPTVLGPSKPAPLTSLLTGGVLLIFAFTYATLDLSFATITTTATGLIWLFIFWQSLRSPGRAERRDRGDIS